MEITHQGIHQTINAALDALDLSEPNRAGIRITTHNLPPGGDLASVILTLEESETDYETLRRLRGGGRSRSGKRPKGLYEHVTATWGPEEPVTNQEVTDACELALIAAHLQEHEVLAITTSLPDDGARADILISRMEGPSGRTGTPVRKRRFNTRCRLLIKAEKSPAEAAARQAAQEKRPPPGLLDLLRNVPPKLRGEDKRRGRGGNKGASPPPRPKSRGP